MDLMTSTRKYIYALLMLVLAVITTIGSSSGGDGSNPGFTGSIDSKGIVKEDVTVKAYKVTDSSDELLATTTTNAKGQFTLRLTPYTEGYLEFSKTGFSTLNSQIITFTGIISAGNASLISNSDTETIIDTAFGGMTLDLADKAYIAIIVVDSNGHDMDGVAVGVLDSDNNQPAGGGSLNCSGNLTGHDETVAPCSPQRTGPMYLAYYNESNMVTVSIGADDPITAPVRMGEVTFIYSGFTGASRVIHLLVEEGGQVTTSPNIGTCVGFDSDCQLVGRVGAKITLTATPNTGWRFDDWNGCDFGTEMNSPSSATCVRTIDISGNNMRAEFDPL